MQKIYPDAKAALDGLLHDGMLMAAGGFGLCGIPERLIDAIVESGIMDFALAKAEAVAAWGFSTAQMADAAKATPGFGQAPHVVTVPGGIPVWSADGKVRIGAVGVSGEAPADDAACAEAGILAAGLRSSRP